jgi:hypothetical protein
MTQLLPADIFFTKGDGWISRRIRKRSRSRNEPPSEVNHCGVVLTEGTFETAEVIEAAGWKVRATHLSDHYSPDQVTICRPHGISDEQVAAVLATARAYEGRRYGFTKIPLHLADAIFFRNHYVLRRLSFLPFVICSELVTLCFDAIDWTFGVKPKEAQPDDIWDYCLAHPEKYERVEVIASPVDHTE